MPYADFQCMIDDPPGLHNYWSADYHDTFPDDALDVFVKYGFERPSPLSAAAARAVGRRRRPRRRRRHADGEARSVSWITHPFAVWEDPADADANIEWARAFRRDIARYANGGVYLNFIGDEGEDRVRAAYGDGEVRAGSPASRGSGTRRTCSAGNQNIKPA